MPPFTGPETVGFGTPFGAAAAPVPTTPTPSPSAASAPTTATKTAALEVRRPRKPLPPLAPDPEHWARPSIARSTRCTTQLPAAVHNVLAARVALVREPRDRPLLRHAAVAPV